MRRILRLFSAAALLLALPTAAQAQGLKTDFSETIKGPVKLEIIVSEDLAHRANNLPKRQSQRISRTRLNGSFSNNGKYGDKAITFLLNDLKEELVEDFEKRNIVISDKAETILKVTIEKVKPNRSTYNQLKEDSNLSVRSYSIGGAEVSVDISTINGKNLGHTYYDYYSSFGDRPIQGRKSWLDASDAFHSFSKQFSKKLAKAGAANG